MCEICMFESAQQATPGSYQGFEVNDFGLEEVVQFQHKDFPVQKPHVHHIKLCKVTRICNSMV